MAIVSYDWYTTVYMGEVVDETAFPRLEARAEDAVGALTRWRANADNLSTFPTLTQELYKKAICAQVEYLDYNGDQVMFDGSGDVGFTAGKVSVNSRGYGQETKNRAASSLSPLVTTYLEQTGLLYPGVAAVGFPTAFGRWM